MTWALGIESRTQLTKAVACVRHQVMIEPGPPPKTQERNRHREEEDKGEAGGGDEKEHEESTPRQDSSVNVGPSDDKGPPPKNEILDGIAKVRCAHLLMCFH